MYQVFSFHVLSLFHDHFVLLQLLLVILDLFSSVEIQYEGSFFIHLLLNLLDHLLILYFFMHVFLLFKQFLLFLVLLKLSLQLHLLNIIFLFLCDSFISLDSESLSKPILLLCSYRILSHIHSILNDCHLLEHPFLFFLEVIHAILHFVFILRNLFEVLVVFFYLTHIDVHDGMESHSAM